MFHNYIEPVNKNSYLMLNVVALMSFLKSLFIQKKNFKKKEKTKVLADQNNKTVYIFIFNVTKPTPADIVWCEYVWWFVVGIAVYNERTR